MTGQTGRIARRRATHVVSSLLASVMAWSMTVAGARGQTSEIDAIVTLDDGSEHRHRQITRAYHIIEDIRAAEARAKDGITVQQSDRLADMKLAEQVKAAVRRDPDVRTVDVVVFVSKGVITLSGTVSTPHQRSQAEKLASEVEGITAVVNHIAVSSVRP